MPKIYILWERPIDGDPDKTPYIVEVFASEVSARKVMNDLEKLPIEVDGWTLNIEERLVLP